MFWGGGGGGGGGGMNNSSCGGKVVRRGERRVRRQPDLLAHWHPISSESLLALVTRTPAL